jgi:hypothetical protein
MRYIVIISLFLFSCTKTTEIIQTPETRQIHTVLQSSNLVKDLGATILIITIEPVLTCYGVRPGEVARPCDILLEVKCTLTKPINSTIKLELSKLVKVDAQKAGETRPVLKVDIAPNTQEIVFKSLIANSSSEIPDIFRISDVRIYNKVN